MKKPEGYDSRVKDNVKEKRAGFTQWPWKESAGEIYRGNDPICDIIDYHGSEADKANARLIASAPELYEQCKLFERVITELLMQGETGGYEELEKLREVLAKADGGAEA